MVDRQPGVVLDTKKTEDAFENWIIWCSCSRIWLTWKENHFCFAMWDTREKCHCDFTAWICRQRETAVCVVQLQYRFQFKCWQNFLNDPSFITGVCKMKLGLENMLSPRSIAVLTSQLMCSKELGNKIRKKSSENKIGSAFREVEGNLPLETPLRMFSNVILAVPQGPLQADSQLLNWSCDRRLRI